MPAPYEISNLLHGPLEAALIRLYPATLYRWLYETCPEPFTAAVGASWPGGPKQNQSGLGKMPRKDVLVGLLQTVLSDAALGRRLFEALPVATRNVLAVVTWEKRVNLAELETRVGRKVAVLNPEKNRYYWEPFLVPPEHGFLCIVKVVESSRYFGAKEEPPKKADYAAVLPDAVRRAFRTFVPPPPGFDLAPVEGVPKSLLRYACESTVVSHMRLVAEFIAQGHLKYGKSEQVAQSSLKRLRQIVGGPEFFEGAEDDDLLMLRTRLLVGGMAFAGTEARAALLERTDSAEPVRAVFAAVTSSVTFLHEGLLGHVSAARGRQCDYSRPAARELLSFFAGFPSGQWISCENMLAYHTLRDQVPSPFAGFVGLEVRLDRDRDTWLDRVGAGGDNAFQLIGAPMIQGYAFLLAAFGLAEIAYTQPGTANWHRPGKPYLTPFAGLRYARLTTLGEYVLGKRATYEVAAVATVRPAITLDELRLLAMCRNVDALTELALSQFMEKIAPDRYRMTPQSLLRGCASRQDLEERLVLFRRVVAAKPPPVWERFFESTLARIAPLELEAEYVVLKINADEPIRRLFAADPVLRELSLKVEGLRIAVLRSDLKKLARRLEHFGYLSPLPRLVPSR